MRCVFVFICYGNCYGQECQQPMLIVASTLRITSHAHGSGNCNKDFVPPPRNCGSTKALQSSIDGPGGQSKLTTSISDNCFKEPGTGIHRIKLVSLKKFGLVVEQVGIIVKVSAGTVGSVIGTPRELSIQISKETRTNGTC